MVQLLRAACVVVALCAVAALVPAEAQTRREAGARRALSEFTSPTLTRFADEAQFDAYLAALRVVERESYSSAPQLQFAQAQPDPGVQSDEVTEPLCPPEDPACLGPNNEGDASIMVTGTRISAPSNPSITNNQMRGVEEGDIVKQIGDFLLVLQDGRLFVISLRPRVDGAPGLALVDRMNVYRDRYSGIWYDEMLVEGSRVLVTGYSYEEDATELSVFELGEDGRLARLGVFLLSSDDYYDTSNYATRIVGDSLVVYTPYGLDRSSYRYRRFDWPVVRRWLPEEERNEAVEQGVPLFDAAAIYRPVRDSIAPAIHTVSVCPLRDVGPGRDLACRATAFIGPEDAEFYVTGDHAFVWTVPGTEEIFPDDEWRRCRAGNAPQRLNQVMPALLFRVPIAGGEPEVVGTRGLPIDQFSFQADGDRFHALLRHQRGDCYDNRSGEPSLAYLNLPMADFSNRLREAGEGFYTPLPPTRTGSIANRFTDSYLVYGSLSGRRSRPPEEGEREPPTPAFALPINRPQSVRELSVPHSVIRAERAGNDIVLTGYRDDRGLRLSLIELSQGGRVASTADLPGRYESESRSHAFNSLTEADDSGLMGLPTSPKEEDSEREWWRSRASDLSYLSVDGRGRLTPIGELNSSIIYDDEDGVAEYDCEVSCVDWYGNSRPIFTDGRIFALAGVELVEGRIIEGRIGEVRRLNIAAESERLLAEREAAAEPGSKP